VVVLAGVHVEHHLLHLHDRRVVPASGVEKQVQDRDWRAEQPSVHSPEVVCRSPWRRRGAFVISGRSGRVPERALARSGLLGRFPDAMRDSFRLALGASLAIILEEFVRGPLFPQHAH